MNRRKLLSALSSIGVVGIAGCSALPGSDENGDTDTPYEEYDEPELAEAVTDADDIDFDDISSTPSSLGQAHEQAVEQIGATITVEQGYSEGTTSITSKNDSEERQSLFNMITEADDIDVSQDIYTSGGEGFSRIEMPDRPVEYFYSLLESSINVYSGRDVIIPIIENSDLEQVGSGSTGTITVYEYEGATESSEIHCVISEQGAVLSLTVESSQPTEFEAFDFGRTTFDVPSWVSNVDPEEHDDEPPDLFGEPDDF